MNTDFQLYKDVEITLLSICVAAVKISVEIDVESLVSIYKKHLKVDRQITEEHAEEEMEIAENGPLLVHAVMILRKAMTGAWHFVQTRQENIFARSMDRLQVEKSKLGFMCA